MDNAVWSGVLWLGASCWPCAWHGGPSVDHPRVCSCSLCLSPLPSPHPFTASFVWFSFVSPVPHCPLPLDNSECLSPSLLCSALFSASSLSSLSVCLSPACLRCSVLRLHPPNRPHRLPAPPRESLGVSRWGVGVCRGAVVVDTGRGETGVSCLCYISPRLVNC